MLLLEEKTRESGLPADRGGMGARRGIDMRSVLKFRKPIIALVVFSSVSMAEIALFRLWLRSEIFTVGGLFRLLLAVLTPLLAIVLAVGFQALFEMIPGLRTKTARSFRLDEKQVLYRRRDRSHAWRWKHVRRWFFSPSANGADYETLTLETGSENTPGSMCYLSMEIDSRDQKGAFLSELEFLRQKDITCSEVVRLNGPIPERKVSFKGIWTVILAVWLLYHGLPMLILGVMPHNSRETRSEYAAAEKEKLGRTMLAVVRAFDIRSVKELRYYFGISGGVVTASAVLLFWKANRMRREEQAVFDETHQRALKALEATPGRC